VDEVSVCRVANRAASAAGGREEVGSYSSNDM
jgi:hypothetical protein